MPVSDSLTKSTHTLAEILSQPATWLSVTDQMRRGAEFSNIVEKTAARKEWIFVGCGTSYYLAEAAASIWTLFTSEPARAIPGSEILLFPKLAPLHHKDLQAVVISRSGKTSEAVRAAQVLNGQHKIPTLGITCAINSELSRVCTDTFVLGVADEKSMVMTRSFSSMLLALVNLAAHHAGSTRHSDSFETIARTMLPKMDSLNHQVEAFVASHSFADYIFLAQGPFFSIAREAALKTTEMSCSYAQPYHTLEFRHGPKSVVGPETCLMFLLSETGLDAESEVLTEMKELGATIIAVCNRANDAVRASSDLLIELDLAAPESSLVAPFIVPGQLLGFHTGVKKGFNPDEPKNLSRVVILD